MRSNQLEMELQQHLLDNVYDDEERKEVEVMPSQINIPILDEEQSFSTTEPVHLNEIEAKLERLSQDIPATVNMLERNIRLPRRTCDNRIIGVMLGFMTIGSIAAGIRSLTTSDHTTEGTTELAIGLSVLLLMICCNVKDRYDLARARRDGYLASLNNGYRRERLISNLSTSNATQIQTTMKELDLSDIQINEQSGAQEIRQASSVILEKQRSITTALLYNRDMKSAFFKTADQFNIPKVISELIVEYASNDPTIKQTM